MEVKLNKENQQLQIIRKWLDKKQIQENNEINCSLITAPHNYFEEFYIDFNLPDSVGLKTQSEVIAQNKQYNELYVKHRDLIAELKCLTKKFHNDIDRDVVYPRGYLSALFDLVKRFEVVDSVNEELRERGVKGV